MEHALATSLSSSSSLIRPSPALPSPSQSTLFRLRSPETCNLDSFTRPPSTCHPIRTSRAPAPSFAHAESRGASDSAVTTDLTGLFKRVLLPIIDRNPYLSEATRQAAATTTALAKKYGAEITVVVIDEDSKETITDHELRMDSIRWHLAQGGFEEFGLMERMGEGKRPAAVIGEVADDLSLDLVVLSMETIHSKHIDGNLLAEFVPCPVLLLPL